MESTRGHPYDGLLLIFEGPDGSGKSTQREMAANYLMKQGYVVTRARDPGGTEIGDEIRQILLHLETKDMSPITEAFLFCASRAQLIAEVIRPALVRGESVLGDRLFYSTKAYQGAGGGVPNDQIDYCTKMAIQEILPDRVYLHDLEASVGLARVGRKDRMESKDLDFHERVRQEYLKMARQEPERIVVVDGTQSVEEIHQQIVADLETYIDQHQLRGKLLRTGK